MSDHPHIIFTGRTESFPYSGFGRKIIPNAERENRQAHGKKIQSSMEDAVQEFSGGDEDFQFIYVEFDSAIDFELDLNKFEDRWPDTPVPIFGRRRSRSEEEFRGLGRSNSRCRHALAGPIRSVLYYGDIAQRPTAAPRGTRVCTLKLKAK